jgi:hypothetical protein
MTDGRIHTGWSAVDASKNKEPRHPPDNGAGASRVQYSVQTDRVVHGRMFM